MEYTLEGLMPKLKLKYFGHLMQRTDSLEKTLMLGKTEGGRRGGQQRMRWLDGSMDMSLSKLWSWWWSGKPGVLQSMGSNGVQRVGHDWVTELNWAGGAVVKNLPANAGDARDLSSNAGSGRSPEQEVETQSSILAWKISWTEEPGGLQSMGLQRVGHDWTHTHTHHTTHHTNSYSCLPERRKNTDRYRFRILHFLAVGHGQALERSDHLLSSSIKCGQCCILQKVIIKIKLCLSAIRSYFLILMCSKS